MRGVSLRKIWRGVLFYVGYGCVSLVILSALPNCGNHRVSGWVPPRVVGLEEGPRGVSLLAYPPLQLSPGMVVLTGIVRGPDSLDMWCPLVSWNYGDGESSSHAETCDDFVPGESHIQRTYRVVHPYRTFGQHTAVLSFYQGERQVGFSLVVVHIGVE